MRSEEKQTEQNVRYSSGSITTSHKFAMTKGEEERNNRNKK
jgi:beta-glucanase (GH16 family)